MAEWSSFEGDTTNLGWDNIFASHFSITNYSADGVGSDTVGYFGIKGSQGSGFQLNFDELTFKISIGPIDDFYDGYTICLDTSFFGGSGFWGWAYNFGNNVFYPDWDGPHCFTIESDITYSGYLNYLDPLPPDTNVIPMRFLKIEMWDEDLFPNPDDLLDFTYCGYDGFFDLGPVPNDDIFGGQDIYFRIYAENDAVFVTQTYNGNIYDLQTPTQDDVNGGSYDTTIIADLTESGYFGLADIVLEAYDEWLTIGSYAPSAVQVVLAEGVGTNFNWNQRTIYIDKSDIDSLAFPDTWDRYAIYHEYGHLIEWDLEFFDDTLGGQHSLTESESLDLASREAFAHWIARVLSNNPVLRNYYNNFNTYYWVNLENGEWGYNNDTSGSRNSYGKNYELAVAGILWDIYDNANDDYDNDGIADTLSLGVDEIIETLNRNISAGNQPDNINDFWEAWFLSPSYGHLRGMMDIWHEHGACCVGMSGDVNWDGIDPNILDLTYIIDRIFRGGDLPPCPLEADLNGDGTSANIIDLTYMIDFIFRGGADPVDCP